MGLLVFLFFCGLEVARRASAPANLRAKQSLLQDSTCRKQATHTPPGISRRVLQRIRLKLRWFILKLFYTKFTIQNSIFLKSLPFPVIQVCLSFNPQSTLVATGSMDTTAKLWDIQNGEEVFTLRVRASCHQLRELCIFLSHCRV